MNISQGLIDDQEFGNIVKAVLLEDAIVEAVNGFFSKMREGYPMIRFLLGRRAYTERKFWESKL